MEMKAIQVRELGTNAELRLTEIPEPRPKEGEVLVEVKGTGVNYADILMLGRHPVPYVPGLEASGIIREVGQGVADWRAGQRVMGTVLGEVCGCYAEKAVMPAGLLMPLPEQFRFEDGAAFPAVFITAYLALKVFGHLDVGENVLIHAAAGGVGTAAVQIAHAMGARVFATASTDEKLQRVSGLGADVLINYTARDFVEEVQKNTGGKGVDLVLESVGGEVFEKSLRCLRPLGRMVAYGTSSGQRPSLNVLDLMQGIVSVSGFSFGRLSVVRRDVVRQAMQAVMDLLAHGKVRPVVGHTFPLAEARAAHDLLSSRASFGKVVLIP